MNKLSVRTKLSAQSKLSVQQVVTKYRKQHGVNGTPMTYRSMSEQLTAVVQADGYNIGHQTIANWEAGVHVPHAEVMIALANRAEGWMRQFAFDVLAALNALPNNWGI